MHKKRFKKGQDMDAPPKGSIKTCQHEGCDQSHKAYGLCTFHYQRKKAGKSFNTPRGHRYEVRPQCKVKDCTNLCCSNGFCRKHWNQCRIIKFQAQAFLGLSHCSQDKCYLPLYTKGLCAKHYKHEILKKEKQLPLSKKCKTCQEWKMFDGFNTFGLSKDGLSYDCKSCVSVRNKQIWRANTPRYMRTKKRWEEQNKDRIRAREKQRRLDDPIKYSLQQKQYRIKNIEKIREKERRYGQENREKVRLQAAKRRARKKNNKVFKVIDKDLRKLLNDPCIYCGGPAEHIEHKIPISRGGPHGIGNLAPSCANCNLTKHTKFVYEFKIWRKRISERQLTEGSNLES